MKVQLKNICEQIRIIFHYYHHWKFAKADLALALTYLFDNPFKLSKRFLINKGEKEIYAYGETPLTTLDEIVKYCHIQSTDIVFELGCGRGLTCFWLSTILGCQVVGVDYLPEFMMRAQRIQRKLKINNLQFRLEDMTETNLQTATVIYLYGTCLDDATIQKMIQKFSTLPSGTKIITISYTLLDYCDSRAPFELMKHFEAPFTWGKTDVYLHIVK